MSALPQLGFMESVKKVLLQNYVNFSGRARRSEFWFYNLFLFIIEIILNTIFIILKLSTNSNTPSGNATYLDFNAFPWYLKTILIIEGILSLAFFLPSLAAWVRRLHDIGKSGWWILIGIIPIVNFVGGFVLLYFFILDSQFEANEYGPSPKYMSVSEGGFTEGGVTV